MHICRSRRPLLLSKAVKYTLKRRLGCTFFPIQHGNIQKYSSSKEKEVKIQRVESRVLIRDRRRQGGRLCYKSEAEI